MYISQCDHLCDSRHPRPCSLQFCKSECQEVRTNTLNSVSCAALSCQTPSSGKAIKAFWTLDACKQMGQVPRFSDYAGNNYSGPRVFLVHWNFRCQVCSRCMLGQVAAMPMFWSRLHFLPGGMVENRWRMQPLPLRTRT